MSKQPGVKLVYDLRAIDKLEERINGIAGFDRGALLETIGAEVETQTRWRIEKEKTDPEGKAWPEWSPEYKKTRKANQSLLVGESVGGGLLGSLGHYPSDDSVEIGSNLIYSATHQMGDEKRNIPARAYLGLSNDDEAELEEVIDDFISSAMKEILGG